MKEYRYKTQCAIHCIIVIRENFIFLPVRNDENLLCEEFASNTIYSECMACIDMDENIVTQKLGKQKITVFTLCRSYYNQDYNCNLHIIFNELW